MAAPTATLPILTHYLGVQKAAFPERMEGFDNKGVRDNLRINSQTDFAFAMGYLASVGTTALTAKGNMLCGRATLIGGKNIELTAQEIELAGDVDAPVQIVALESLKINAAVLKFRNVNFYVAPLCLFSIHGAGHEVTNLRITAVNLAYRPLTRPIEFYHFRDRNDGTTDLEITPTVLTETVLRETLRCHLNSPLELKLLYLEKGSKGTRGSASADTPAKKPGSRDEGSPAAPPAPVSSAPGAPVPAPPPGPTDQH